MGPRLSRAVLVVAIVTAATVTMIAKPAAASVHEFEIVKATSGSNSSSIKFITAYCPEGKKVIGTGWSISGAAGEAHIALVDASFEDWVTVVAVEDDDGTSQTWSVSAHAACALPPPGLEIVHAEADGTFYSEHVTAECPDGKHVLGTGGWTGGPVHDVILTEIVPTETGVSVAAWEDEDGTTEPWTVSAMAICADPLPDVEIVEDTSAFNSNSTKSETTVCPGKRAIGGGAELGVGVGEVFLTALYPAEYMYESFVTARGQEDKSGKDYGWTVTTYAICMNAYFD